MDLSPVQSSSKCTSDFSIDRILSTRGRDEEQAAPSWLCCTRYQPPRVPRPSSHVNRTRARRSGRHARVPFTATQAAALEAAYSRAPYLAPPALRALAAALQLRDDRIKIWFQNRRARERREKSTNITPPNAITLPATRLQAPTLNWNPQSTRTPTVVQSGNSRSPETTVQSRISETLSQNHKTLQSSNSGSVNQKVTFVQSPKSSSLSQNDKTERQIAELSSSMICFL